METTNSPGNPCWCLIIVQHWKLFLTIYTSFVPIIWYQFQVEQEDLPSPILLAVMDVEINTLRFMFCKSQVTLVAFLWTLFYWSMFIFKNIAQKKTENPIYGLSAAKQIEMTSSLDLQKILMLTQNDSCLFASLIWHI